MMRRLCAALLALMVTLLVQGPGAGWARDSALQSLNHAAESRGWEGVGRIDLGGGSFCSGVLIAPDLVLTAAHCVYLRQTGHSRALTTLRFRAGLRVGQAVAERAIRRTVVHPVFAAPGTSQANRIKHDLALLELAQPIEASVATPFEVRAMPAVNGAVSVVSYGGDRAASASWQRHCSVLKRYPRLGMLSCDVTHGSSGAPVFDLSGGRARIVSIISSGRRVDGRRVAYGMDVPPVLADLRAALSSGVDVIASDVPMGPAGIAGARFLIATSPEKTP